MICHNPRPTKEKQTSNQLTDFHYFFIILFSFSFSFIFSSSSFFFLFLTQLLFFILLHNFNDFFFDFYFLRYVFFSFSSSLFVCPIINSLFCFDFIIYCFFFLFLLDSLLLFLSFTDFSIVSLSISISPIFSFFYFHSFFSFFFFHSCSLDMTLNYILYWGASSYY